MKMLCPEQTIPTAMDSTVGIVNFTMITFRVIAILALTTDCLRVVVALLCQFFGVDKNGYGRW